MVSRIEDLNSIKYYQPAESTPQSIVQGSLHSFEIEDKAIISAQAKLLNELEKYNSGAGNDIDLALTRINSENIVNSMVKVMNTKKYMMDTIMQIGE